MFYFLKSLCLRCRRISGIRLDASILTSIGISPRRGRIRLRLSGRGVRIASGSAVSISGGNGMRITRVRVGSVSQGRRSRRRGRSRRLGVLDIPGKQQSSLVLSSKAGM